MIVELTEVVTYAIEVPDDCESPEELAEEIYCQSVNPWNDFDCNIEERILEIRK